MADFKLLAGLGNPGERYAATRHNFGFMVADRVAALLESGGQLRWKEGFGALFLKGRLNEQDLLLVKPLTFMNLSGRALSEIGSYFKISPLEMVVVHDDIDLPFGALRIRKGCGDGGHKGVRSITESLGSNDYVRVRCGVGRPKAEGPEVGRSEAGRMYESVPDFVLDRFDQEERARLDEFLDRSVAAVSLIFDEGLAAAQGKFNREV